eukprot:SAG11_NODE_23920_length_381_cov_0.726950_1_plen_65_part_00
MGRVAHVDCAQNLLVRHPQEERKSIKAAIAKKRPIPARKIYKLLLSHGGFRPNAQDTFDQGGAR